MSALVNQARNRVPRIAEAAVERARLTVVPRTTTGRRAARVPFVALVSLLLVGGVAGLLCFNTSMQQASFTATAMEARAQVLDAREQSLTMQLDDLRDPQRVALRAKEMGMVAPSSPAFIRLADGKVLGHPTPATYGNVLRVTPFPTRKPKNLRPTPVVIEGKPVARTGGTSAPDGAATTAGGSRAGTKKSNDRHRQQGSQR
jgi:cell division protein FtsB